MPSVGSVSYQLRTLPFSRSSPCVRGVGARMGHTGVSAAGFGLGPSFGLACFMKVLDQEGRGVVLVQTKQFRADGGISIWQGSTCRPDYTVTCAPLGAAAVLPAVAGTALGGPCVPVP